MEIAKVFENGRSQAVRLPKKFRFDVDEVIVQRLGNAIILVPDNMIWETFLNGINSFSEDIFENGRDSEIPNERESI
ncbi:MAG: AbrB/MazE/SpoVT family DNA-binding domain-containing protein [Clostridia bacterium]|nr:AbrB/MazE/SpoVT family DNA-binding domain-containing protein [Clostridia bacterium]